jgi:hypothetical protein
VGWGQAERELEENPARLGKGTSRLWDMILLGRDGMETRQMVLMANHAALDGDSICLWRAQILAALPQHAKAPQQVGDSSSFHSPVQDRCKDRAARSHSHGCLCSLILALVCREPRCRLHRWYRSGPPWTSSSARA